jgi:L-alanine-DL-glutamate epimerase-like enolase superfamily enzyme
LKVVELTALRVRIPLKRAIKHASHTRTETDNLIIRCVLADGTEGFGEGVPREYVTSESVESAIELLKRSDLAGQLKPCEDFAAAVAMIERVQPATVPGDDRNCQGNAARCALELALLDAYGRKYYEPLSTVTRLLSPDIYEPKPRVRYSGALTTARGNKARIGALAMRLYRFKHLKVKVGIPGYEDVKRLRMVRRWAGRTMDLRVDANEAWSPAEAAERIRELEPFGLSAVEQPVPHENVNVLAEVRRQVKTPILLDESLCTMTDAERAVEQGTCDSFNVRLSKCGGFIPSLRLVQFAKQKGLTCQLGCQVGETAILSAAGRHFAATVSGLRAVEGSYDRHLVQEPLGAQDLTFGWGGWAPILVSTGHGALLDPAALERVTVRKETLLG